MLLGFGKSCLPRRRFNEFALWTPVATKVQQEWHHGTQLDPACQPASGHAVRLPRLLESMSNNIIRHKNHCFAFAHQRAIVSMKLEFGLSLCQDALWARLALVLMRA
jgi:hypothetical protein